MPSLLENFRRQVGTLIEGDIVNADFKPVVVDEEVLNKTRTYASRYRCSQRLGKGLFYTDSERKAEYDRMSRIKLP